MKPLYPKSSFDTLMACFALYLYNDESKKHQIKEKIVKHLPKECVVKEGYISDKMVYISVFANLYRVNVLINESLISVDGAYYTMVLFHNVDRFHLLIPDKRVKKMETYELRKCNKEECPVIVKCIAPPPVEGYRVHMCQFYSEQENELFLVFPRGDFKIREQLYIYLDKDKLVGYVDLDSKSNAYFYVKEKGHHTLYVVPSKSQEEALQSIQIELK